MVSWELTAVLGNDSPGGLEQIARASVLAKARP